MASLFSTLVIAGLVASNAAPLRVACVGDSITYGTQSITAQYDVTKTSYPALLQGMLDPAEYEITRLGKNGAKMQREQVVGPQNSAWWDLKEFETLTNQTW